MQPINILIVEDERLVAKDIAETLESLHYHVAGTCSAAEAAIAQIQQQRPDLVLMDIRLAGQMDGVEATQIIQRDYQLPVVYLTANADLPTLDRAKASRPFGYLLKPFDETMLATTIEIALSRHQAEHEIQSALSSAHDQYQVKAQQVEEKLQYFAMAAHELRNPLGVIRSVAEILNSPEVRLPAERRTRYLERMQVATDNLDELLRSILTYSYSSAGKLDSSPVSMDLVQFCQEQMEVLQASIGQQHQFSFQPQGPTCPVYLDEQLMWHLLTNLLSNAIKYSPMPDRIGPGEVNLALTWDKTHAQLVIQDNGLGIPPEARSRLFEPFYRADNVTNLPGTGLGLAIVQQCVLRQNGRIELVDSDQGARFVVTLPINDREMLF